MEDFIGRSANRYLWSFWLNRSEARDLKLNLFDCRLRLNPFIHVLGPPQRILHVVADILCPDYFFELCLMNQLRGLLARSAENQRALAGLQGLGDFLNRE